MPAAPLTLLDLFDEVVATDGEREAFVHPLADGTTRRITFREWADHADGLAQRLIADGVAKGDVVAIRLPSGIDYVIAYQAIVRAGAIATGINPRLGDTEFAHIADRARPVLTIDAALPSYEVGDGSARRVVLVETDPVAIVWTGGTTGLPKGAWFDHACLRAMTEGAAPLSEHGDRRLSPLPFAHVGAMTRVWDELHHRITTVIVPTPWTPAAALRVIESERVTVAQGVPTQYRMMFDAPEFEATDVSSLRIAGIGAARIPPELVTEMRDKLGCPVVVRYASTESCVATGTRLDDAVDTICTTVGRPNGGVEMRIVDQDDRVIDGRTVGGKTVDGATVDGAVGGVQLRSRAAMRGYWNDPEQTAAAITADGWVRTGDLGEVLADGNLRLAGRSTELFIRGGYNVYPIEIENCLGDHADIAAAAVLGASVDDRLGEIGVLVAVPRLGRTLVLSEIRGFVADRLANYKAPDALAVVDELPLTPIGKVDKRALQPLADQHAATWTR